MNPSGQRRDSPHSAYTEPNGSSVSTSNHTAILSVLHQYGSIVHIDPQGVAKEHFAHPSRQLPPGVSVWQVYTDYLQRLHTAAVERFKSRRGTTLFDNLATQDRIQYILTVPAAWQSVF